MRIRKTILVIFGILVFCVSSFAFEQKDINDLKKLSDFETVEQFEVYYEDYTQTCLDNGYGGTDSIPCFITYELWDRELNIYYQKLYEILNENQKKELKKSQLKWLEARDLTINFNSIMLDNYYQDKEGTMYMLMRARDADDTIHHLVKERALFLKSWFVQKSEPIEK
ncbi:LprI family protein (DUF1311 domain) [Aliarcobacter faecis]|uniref:lysozyme inhibitor LprI family protein n=1 Tax=Aliarcobacter faecis TaxID=1564138 RepID=UPI0004B95536|nr:lysozyme inhibitor LprI family protein [Aliarcobacter faecis]QKF73929.1 LprI family protein (DUF1311 domain) [Aliarcobacter faecis]